MATFSKQDFTDTMRDIRERYYVSPTMRKLAADYALDRAREAHGQWRDGEISTNARLIVEDWADSIVNETKGV